MWNSSSNFALIVYTTLYPIEWMRQGTGGPQSSRLLAIEQLIKWRDGVHPYGDAYIHWPDSRASDALGAESQIIHYPSVGPNL